MPPDPGTKAGFMARSFSTLRGIWVLSSLETMVGGFPLAPGISTGAISDSKRPFFSASCALVMLRIA